MHTEKVHTLVLGAGPAGLAAGYVLANAGLKPVIIEKEDAIGGLMRSVKHQDSVVDIGRKELYNRIEKVDRFWAELLGEDYLPYPHRGGVLYEGVIIDMSPAYRGYRRGMPWSMFMSCLLDFLKAQAAPKSSQPRSVEEYFYQKRGRRMTQIFSQGFQEKLAGRKWSDVPVNGDIANADDRLVRMIKSALIRTFSAKEPNNYQGVWRHPAKGTGQICNLLSDAILERGGRIHCAAKAAAMNCSADRVREVEVDANGSRTLYQTANVITSIPLEILLQLLGAGCSETESASVRHPTTRRKTVVLVYLFLDEPARFPHFWLNVTCPKTRIARITNYAALNGSMVPPGKAALCCEFYCFGEDAMLLLDDNQFAELALEDCARFGLLNRVHHSGSLVLRLPGADASQNRHNWLSNIRLGLLQTVMNYKNLYYVNRSDLDIATFAGIDAAEAIISGNRVDFDRHIDPANIGIRGETKHFEFKNPAGYEATLA